MVVVNAMPKMSSGKQVELSPLLSGCQHCHGLRCTCGKKSSSVELQRNQHMPLVRRWAIHRVQADPYFKFDPILVTFPSTHSPTNASPRRPKSQQSRRSNKSKPEADDFNARRAAADALFGDLGGQERSACIRESFHELRRATSGEDGQGPEESLVNTTLRDTEDSVESLSKVIEKLDTLQDPVLMVGATRHATAITAARALAVVQRKRELIRSCEERIVAFEKTQARREEILDAVIEGHDPPQDIVGIDKFISSKTHKGGLNPADDKRPDFQAFSQTFGLPPGHQSLRRLKAVAREATLWWARVASEQAHVSVDMMPVQRLLDLSEKIIGKWKNPHNVEARDVMSTTMADKVLASCEALIRKDEAFVGTMSTAQPESARTCADLINSQIKIAVSMGTSPMHSKMIKAKKLAAQLFMEEKTRLAQRVLEYARAHKEMAEQEVLGPHSGSGAAAAEKIQIDVKNAVAGGAPSAHPSIQEAQKIAKECLDFDALRKRLATREKRRSEKLQQ